jgi:hypothetical protein
MKYVFVEKSIKKSEAVLRPHFLPTINFFAITDDLFKVIFCFLF